MKNFEFSNPTKLVFGKDALDKISENAAIYGKKILVTYGGGSIKKNGIYTKVMEQLKSFEVAEFGGIEPNPRVETIRKAVALARDFKPDLVLAVGGGSVIDGSKLLVAAVNYQGDAWDFLINPETEPEKYIPLAVVLTMSATGSEMNSGAVITNWSENIKTFFGKPACYPKFSILDPQNLFSLPADQSAYGIVDAYSHILEQYITNSEDVALQDRWSEGVLLTLIENGPITLKKPTDYAARANVMLAATMALNGLVAMGCNQDWATHNIEHEISAFYDIPHAAGLAIITPRWLEVVKAEKLARIAHYGRQVWNLYGETDLEVADLAIEYTFKFFESLGIKMFLKDWSIDNKHFDVMVARLAEKGIGERILTSKEIEEILTKCL
jgi:alcohol dehydrogenase YqhD (iron-dependent ADH family)